MTKTYIHTKKYFEQSIVIMHIRQLAHFIKFKRITRWSSRFTYYVVQSTLAVWCYFLLIKGVIQALSDGLNRTKISTPTLIKAAM